MTRYLNVNSAVHATDDVAALRLMAERIAQDLDAAETPELRSTLSRTLATCLTTLRLSAEAAERKKKDDGGPSLAEVIGIGSEAS